MARDVQGTQNRKLVIFLQYIEKSVTTAFAFYCDDKHSDILLRSSQLCLLLLIICKINLMLTCSSSCIIWEADRATTFAIIDKKFYVPVGSWLTQENKKLWEQLK